MSSMSSMSSMHSRIVKSHASAARFATLTLAGLLVVAGMARAETYPQKRGGWFIGFGAGGGWAALTNNGQSTDREGAGAGSFRAGYDFSPELGLGLETNAWSKSQDVQGLGTATTTLSTGAATLYFHPPTNGLVLRGGVGFGSADAKLKVGSTTVTGTNSGFGLTLGAQYDFRVRRTFSIGPEVDWSWMTLDPFDANYLMVGLSFDWHFIGK